MTNKNSIVLPLQKKKEFYCSYYFTNIMPVLYMILFW